MKSVYEKYKDSQTTSGAGTKKPPKFFDDLDNFLNDKPDATGVANAIDTSDDTVNEAGNESDVDIGNIIIISFTLKVLPHGKCKYLKMGHIFTVCYTECFYLDDMVQKYGEGSVIEKPCPDCGYVVKLQSSGVHTADNGCLQVYCEDEEFNYPNCSYTDKGKN